MEERREREGEENYTEVQSCEPFCSHDFCTLHANFRAYQRPQRLRPTISQARGSILVVVVALMFPLVRSCLHSAFSRFLATRPASFCRYTSPPGIDFNGAQYNSFE